MRAALRTAGRARGSAAVRRAAEHSARARADERVRPDDRHRRARHGARRPTARASPRTASAPATRRWSSTRRRTSSRPRATRASARPTTTDRAARPTATCSSTRRIYDAFLRAAAGRGRIPRRRPGEASCSRAPTGTPMAIARRTRSRGRPRRSRELAGFAIPAGKTFLIVEEQQIGKQHLFSTEKLGIVLAVFKYHGFDTALDMVRQIFETGGKGHSCGIYSFDDDHIHRLALVGAGEPHHGAAGAVELERRDVHERHADDVEHGLRHVGRQHHEREHLPQALHERHLGEPARSRRTGRRSRNCSASSTTARSSRRQSRHV